MITPSWYPSARQLRQFAAISLVGFGVFGYIAWHKHAPRVAETLWAVGVATFLIGMPFPFVIRPLYAFLIALTLPIGWVVTNVLLRLIYYVAFTPIGLFFRLTGRDPLQIRKPKGDSYWLDHPERTDLSSYYRQA